MRTVTLISRYTVCIDLLMVLPTQATTPEGRPINWKIQQPLRNLAVFPVVASPQLHWICEWIRKSDPRSE
jgi:hypothetical protein